MPTAHVIPFAPAFERQRRLISEVSLLSWDNFFPDGIEDLWAGPFKLAGSGKVVPLFVH